MIYGFENEKFYVDIPSCTREVGNMREETERRAVEISKKYKKPVLSFSGGLDSQSVLHSFITQGLPIETVFMHIPGNNDHEYDHIKKIDQKYGISTTVIEMNPEPLKAQLQEESKEYKIQIYSLFWKEFLKLIPDDWDLVQMVHDPYIYYDKGVHHYFTSFHGPEIARERAFNLVERSGSVICYGDTSEFLLSILTEDAMIGGIYSTKYLIGNNLLKPGTNLKTFDRWDYFVKPVIYGQRWKKELIYFTKFVGYEKLDWLQVNLEKGIWDRPVLMPLPELIDHLKSMNGTTKRFYSNDL
jgi:hypothetical protein